MTNYILPQHDSNPRRATDLQTAQQNYTWDMTYGVPVSTKLYPGVDASGPGWVGALGAAGADIRTNMLTYGRKTKRKYSKPLPPSLFEAGKVVQYTAESVRSKTVSAQAANFFLPDLGYGVPSGIPDSLQDYKDMFAPVGTFPLPDIAERFDTDEGFAYNFVAGPNPIFVRRMTARPSAFPIDNSHYQKQPDLAGDTFEAALAAGRIYYCDYAINNKLEPGTHMTANGLRPKYVYQPFVAFGVTSSGELRPFAIQCGQDPNTNPIFTPDMGYSWKIARNCVLASHNTMHEVLMHLGFTHLLMEPILVATRRQLHVTHPVYALLRHHFEGTMLINNGATHNLIQKGAAVDQLIGASMDSVYPYLVENRLAYSFTGNYLPVRLKEHGTDDTRLLPNYPYRDDALLLWYAILRFTTNFVNTAYSSDIEIRADQELQYWAKEIAAPPHVGGAVKDFGATPGSIQSRTDLAQLLCMTIYTGSAQHAAVNFSQKTDMMFTPANPLCGSTPAPTSPNLTEADYLAHLPPLETAVIAVEMLYLLGSVYYTRLGDYTHNLGMKDFQEGGYAQVVSAFQAELRAIEDTITNNNKNRVRPYIHLLPSRIPQGINI